VSNFLNKFLTTLATPSFMQKFSPPPPPPSLLLIDSFGFPQLSSCWRLHFCGKTVRLCEIVEVENPYFSGGASSCSSVRRV